MVLATQPDTGPTLPDQIPEGWRLSSLTLYPFESAPFNGSRLLAVFAVDYRGARGEPARMARGRYIEDQYGERGLAFRPECRGIVPTGMFRDIETEIIETLQRWGVV